MSYKGFSFFNPSFHHTLPLNFLKAKWRCSNSTGEVPPAVAWRRFGLKNL